MKISHMWPLYCILNYRFKRRVVDSC